MTSRVTLSNRFFSLSLSLSFFFLKMTTDIELAEKQTVSKKHGSSDSFSSFIHFKGSLPKEPIESLNTPSLNPNQLATQALPSLIICVIGLVVAGWMMDIYQHWQVFTDISELFILVPVLLNLKGNLEMNLAARFSTCAHMGALDHPQTRNALVLGNLALIQVQSLISGAVAGLFSVILGLLLHPDHPVSISEISLVVASAMISASVSSFVLGLFMCLLIILSRILRIDPDNIACPMASSLGDVVTLGIMAGCAHLLMIHSDTSLCFWLLFLMTLSIPFFALAVWKNPHVKSLLFSGWTPILLAMLISSGAGLVLERYVERYQGLAMFTPILCGLAGNLGSIYASRISTCLHRGLQEKFKQVERILLMMNVPIQSLFLAIVWCVDIGHLDFTLAFAISYFLVSSLSTFFALKMGKYMTLTLWKYKYDPDNYVLPYLTAVMDVICTTLLVVSFHWLTTTGYAHLSDS
ncbi:hypothetical protein BY458DRAFT_508086 [Sporodiniella umbellata]|nr:hypothetical protein BY458DRAFT_508086 [Sporodiniella umbellata]